MFNKIYEYIKKDIKENYKSYLLFIIIVPWFFISFDYNIYTPGGLISLNDRIEVENDYKTKGSFNLTYVSAKKGTIPIILLSYIVPSWDLVNLDNMRIEDEDESDIIKRNKIFLEETSYDAVISAFDEANISYRINNIDVTVSYVYEYAKTNILLGDIIKTINDVKISDFETLSNEINKYSSGDKINVSVLRDDKIVDCYAVLSENDDKTVIGLLLSEIKDIETNPKVTYIFKDNESGSSRGLMCALDIYNKITEYDLTKGDIISGTGSIDENGIVGSIDGVKYKLAGAVKNNAKVFIVPTDNYDEAIKLKKENKYDIEIIEADNLHNVVEKLKSRK